jgi:hypothetical protein
MLSTVGLFYFVTLAEQFFLPFKEGKLIKSTNTGPIEHEWYDDHP